MKEETIVKGSKVGKTESIRKFGTENFDELQEFLEIATALNFFYQDDLRANRNLGVYKGALYENVAGEALSKSG